MLNSFKLQTRLLLLCSSLCAISIVAGGVGLWALHRVDAEYTVVTTKSLPKMKLVYEIFLEYRQIRLDLKTLNFGDLTPKQTEDAVKSVYADMDHFKELNKKYVALGFVPGQEDLYKNLAEVWKGYNAAATEALQLMGSANPADQEKISKFFHVDAPARAKNFQAAIDALVEFQQRFLDSRVKSSQEVTASANLSITAFILIGLILAAVMSWLFAKSISKTLLAISEALSRGAEKVEECANSVASASEQLSSSTVEQAAALQETTASLEETSAMVSKNAENAKRSADVSEHSQTTVDNGKQAVEKMLNAIQEISSSNKNVKDRVEEGNREIEAIVKLISEIGNKTKVINDIVFQTKLLSFNASVEAARAGEHGKGFAVVAEEVGNLAQMSGTAAKEISEMLTDSIQKVEGIVSNTKTRIDGLMTESQSKIQNGIETAKKCEEILENIVTDVNQVVVMVGEISSASQEQTRGLSEINKAMNQLDEVSQQNSSASSMASSSASNLQNEVISMREIVGRLNATVSGSRAIPISAGPVAQPLVFRPKSATSKDSSSSVPLQKVSNGGHTPSAYDPRFEDV